jgi:methionyl-tRNA formyltransferase
MSTVVHIVCTDPAHGVNAWLERWAMAHAHDAEVHILRDAREATGGDFLFLVSCHQIIGAEIRARYRHTLVLHASALPAGRGMSPHVWQILEGRGGFTLSMLEAVDALDAGRIWHQLEVAVPPDAVCHEINERLFDAELALMDWALAHAATVQPREQHGEPSYYRKRGPADSRLDPERPLAEQFDLLRVSDPDRYPAHFEYRGRRYRLRLEPMES